MSSSSSSLKKRQRDYSPDDYESSRKRRKYDSYRDYDDDRYYKSSRRNYKDDHYYKSSSRDERRYKERKSDKYRSSSYHRDKYERSSSHKYKDDKKYEKSSSDHKESYSKSIKDKKKENNEDKDNKDNMIIDSNNKQKNETIKNESPIDKEQMLKLKKEQEEKEEKEKEEQRLKQREEEQKKLEQEILERKARIAAWREQFLKNKLQEKEQVEKELQEKEATTEQWSFDDDNDGHSSINTTNTDDKMNIDENKEEKNEKEENIIKEEEEEEEEDPLDAYMNKLSKVPIKSTKSNNLRNNNKNDDYNIREDEDDEDEWKQKVRKRDLQQVDHTSIRYKNFRKDFYIEVPEIAKMTNEEVKQYRLSLGKISIRGKSCPKPIKGFHQCGLNDKLLETLKKNGYIKPTPIQAQAIPAIMSGRDVIGIAKTGSGKTLAFILPMFRHILDQPIPSHGEGPIGIIMAPTRELAVQIHVELKRFAKRIGLKSVCIFGGSGISHQIGDLKRGAAIAVCTPGRMIDILCTNAGRVTNLRRVTYLVLDEADRMFDMGFEPQIMRIIDNIRPDRQTVMFSATFPRQVEAAARKILKRPIIEIVVGGISVVCSDVEQIIEFREYDARFTRLLQLLGEWNEKGSILIFVNRQDECDNIFKKLIQAGYKCSTLHGGKDQMDRASTISDFKNGDVTVMVATSVAARGLDVPSLNLVINYSVPSHYEDYVHRCGRTGRAGRKGTAITFISDEDDHFAPDLEKALKDSGTEIPIELIQLTEKYKLKVTMGSAVKHGSGFGGSGYKFDEAEAQAKKKELKLQKKAYLGDEAEEESEEDDNDKFLEEKVVINPSNSTPNVKLSDALSSNPNIQTGFDALLRIINASKSNSATTTEHTAEIDINDYPQQARWKVTHKDALAAITEFTGCAILARGTYYPPGRSAPLGERKLHLYIEGPDAKSLHNAVGEVKRILSESAANAHPEKEQYGKYTI